MSSRNRIEQLPTALRKTIRYNGKVMNSKSFIDLLIDELGYHHVVIVPRKTLNIYSLRNGHMKFPFTTITEMSYIDMRLKDKPNAKYDSLHAIDDLANINRPGIKNMCSPTVSIDNSYQVVLAQIENEAALPHKKAGGPVQDLKRGTILEGPSHEYGGIEIQVNGKPVAEAEGKEIVINGEASEKYCEELSEINQRAGNGIKFDCEPCKHNDKKIIAKNGAIIPSDFQEMEALNYVMRNHFGPIIENIEEVAGESKNYPDHRIFRVKFYPYLTLEDMNTYMEAFSKHWVLTARGMELIDMEYTEFAYNNMSNEWDIIIPKTIDLKLFLHNFNQNSKQK